MASHHSTNDGDTLDTSWMQSTAPDPYFGTSELDSTDLTNRSSAYQAVCAQSILTQINPADVQSAAFYPPFPQSRTSELTMAYQHMLLHGTPSQDMPTGTNTISQTPSAPIQPYGQFEIETLNQPNQRYHVPSIDLRNISLTVPDHTQNVVPPFLQTRTLSVGSSDVANLTEQFHATGSYSAKVQDVMPPFLQTRSRSVGSSEVASRTPQFHATGSYGVNVQDIMPPFLQTRTRSVGSSEGFVQTHAIGSSDVVNQMAQFHATRQVFDAQDPGRLNSPVAYSAGVSLLGTDMTSTQASDALRRLSRSKSSKSHAGAASSTPGRGKDKAEKPGGQSDPKKNPRTKLSYYTLNVQEVIKLAKSIYLGQRVARGIPFPLNNQKRKFSDEAFFQARSRLNKQRGWNITMDSDIYIAKIITKAWDNKRHLLRNEIARKRITDGYGLFAPVCNENQSQPPNASEVAARVHYLIGPDLRAFCHDLDEHGNRMIFDHRVFQETMANFVFESTGNVGVNTAEMFDGHYTLQSAATTCGSIYCCLESYATGTFSKVDFDRTFDDRINNFLELFETMALHSYYGPLLLQLFTYRFEEARTKTTPTGPFETNIEPKSLVTDYTNVGCFGTKALLPASLVFRQTAIDLFVDANGQNSTRPSQLPSLDLTPPHDPIWANFH